MDVTVPKFEWPRALPRTCSYDAMYQAVWEWTAGARTETLAQLLNVPVKSVRRYVQSSAFQSVVRQIRSAVDQDLEHTLTRLTNLSLHDLEDRLEHGNIYFDADGHEKRRPLSASELLSISATLFDKRATARKMTDGVPTHAPDVAESLMAIADALRKHNAPKSEPAIIDIEGE